MIDWACIALKLIAKWEGCELDAYPDPATGKYPYTVGYGATGLMIGKDTVWTQAKADQDLLQRVGTINNTLNPSIPGTATANQRAAIISLAYNVGPSAVGDSTLLRDFNAGDIEATADQFLRWNHANGKVMDGLTRRRKDERLVFLGGTP